jgi:hypothetical protein
MCLVLIGSLIPLSRERAQRCGAGMDINFSLSHIVAMPAVPTWRPTVGSDFSVSDAELSGAGKRMTTT